MPSPGGRPVFAVNAATAGATSRANFRRYGDAVKHACRHVLQPPFPAV